MAESHSKLPDDAANTGGRSAAPVAVSGAATHRPARTDANGRAEVRVVDPSGVGVSIRAPAADPVNPAGVAGLDCVAFNYVFDGANWNRWRGAVTATGAAASGAAASGHPVLVAGSDGTNARTLSTTAAGLQKVQETTAAPARNSAAAAAPAAGAVIADTGALAAGTYRIEFHLAAMDTPAVGKGMVVEHRNAANGATLARLGACVAGTVSNSVVMHLTVAASERVRVVAGTAPGAALSLYVAHVAAYPLG